MNKYLKTGLLMELFQIAILGIFAAIYALVQIEWTLALIAIVVFCIFNVAAFALIAVGLIGEEE